MPPQLVEGTSPPLFHLSFELRAASLDFILCAILNWNNPLCVWFFNMTSPEDMKKEVLPKRSLWNKQGTSDSGPST